MKKLGITSSIIVIFSLFLPWYSVVKTTTGMNSGTSNFGGSSGIITDYGILGLILGGVSLYLFIKEIKWASLLGILIIIDGLLFIYGISKLGGSASGGYGRYSQSVEVGTEPQFGIYLFILGGLVCAFSGYKIFKDSSGVKNLITNKENVKSNNYEIGLKTKPKYIFKILPYIFVIILVFFNTIEDVNPDILFIPSFILIISSIYSIILNFNTDQKNYLKFLKTFPLLLFIIFGCWIFYREFF